MGKQHLYAVFVQVFWEFVTVKISFVVLLISLITYMTLHSTQDDHQQRIVKFAQEPSNEPAEGTDPSSGSDRRDNNPNCFTCQVCYNERVNRFLLPCRHARLCTDQILLNGEIAPSVMRPLMVLN